jgi:hypothetical protein
MCARYLFSSLFFLSVLLVLVFVPFFNDVFVVNFPLSLFPSFRPLPRASLIYIWLANGPCLGGGGGWGLEEGGCWFFLCIFWKLIFLGSGIRFLFGWLTAMGCREGRREEGEMRSTYVHYNLFIHLWKFLLCPVGLYWRRFVRWYTIIYVMEASEREWVGEVSDGNGRYWYRSILIVAFRILVSGSRSLTVFSQRCLTPSGGVYCKL